jgi:protein-L-isoaspartate(D-aspartate) O-methyltransferase
LSGLALLFSLAACAADTTAGRDRMIAEQIQARGIRDPRVIDAMRQTPRERFVPERERFAAFADHPLPIGHGQTISQPYIVALMTELLDAGPGHRVLEIGTGSGYQAAILSRLAKEVHSIEIVPELARSARELLAKLGHANVTVHEGDGYRGLPELAPFDRVILTAAPPQIPWALADQLARGGRMVAPVGGADQRLIVLEKDADGKVSRREIVPVRFVLMVPGWKKK